MDLGNGHWCKDMGSGQRIFSFVCSCQLCLVVGCCGDVVRVRILYYIFSYTYGVPPISSWAWLHAQKFLCLVTCKSKGGITAISIIHKSVILV